MQTIELDGKPYVLLPQAEYDRLTTLAKAATLPPLPAADAAGNYPASDYARASLARKVINARAAQGMSQRRLAQLAGVRAETICRLEAGKHTPSLATLDKIERALRGGAANRSTSNKNRDRTSPRR